MKLNITVALLIVVSVVSVTLMLKRVSQTQCNMLQIIKLQQQQLNNLENTVKSLKGGAHA